MAFVSSGYNPDKPMENRNSDIGPRKYDEFYPPVIAANKGKWLYHEILKPGVLVHVSETGDEVYTVRCGGARLMSVTHIREICEIADKHCDGYLRFTTRNNIEFMVDQESRVQPLIEADRAGNGFIHQLGQRGEIKRIQHSRDVMAARSDMAFYKAIRRQQQRVVGGGLARSIVTGFNNVVCV